MMLLLPNAKNKMFLLTACHIYCTIVFHMIYDAATAAPLRSTNANVTLLLLTQTLSHFSYTCCGYVREWCACVCVCPNDVYATNQPTFNYVAPRPPLILCPGPGNKHLAICFFSGTGGG